MLVPGVSLRVVLLCTDLSSAIIQLHCSWGHTHDEIAGGGAEECRRLAKLTAWSEHWTAFLEMAETWGKLAELHELGRKLRSTAEYTEARWRAPLIQPAGDASVRAPRSNCRKTGLATPFPQPSGGPPLS
jgi:hypothetical protein